MKWFNIFKLYNIKKVKSEKLIIVFTALSIFITTLISLIVPQITENTKEYMSSSIKKLNGAELMIQGQYPSSKFNKEIDALKSEGYEVKFEGITSSYFKNSSGRNTVGKLIYGDNNIGKDEIILYKTIATNMNVGVGDEIEIESTNNVSKKYTVKEIEDMPYAVDGDSKTLGYGKIDSTESDYDISNSNSFLVFINGEDGEKLKNRISNIEDGFVYTSLKDREKSVQSDVDNQIMSFSVVTTMGYILSIITIITTTIMMILRRKNDFAVLKMLSIPSKCLKRAMFFEIFLIIIIPILIAAISSFEISTLIINATKNVEMISVYEKVWIIVKGVIFNCILFIIFLNMALIMLKSVKALSLVREDESESKKLKKKVITRSILLVPILLFLYSIYVGRLSTFGGGCIILIFILIFLLLVMFVLKLISLIPFKNNVFVYGFNNIRKNYSTFIMIILSITMTIVFLLVGFTLDKTIRESMNKSMEDTLPYDHIVIEKYHDTLEDKFKSSDAINSFSKFYTSSGKINNNNIKYKGIAIHQIKEEDYNTKYKILDGEDLFEGEDNGVLISSKYSRANKLEVNDYLNISTLEGEFQYRIKGIYEGGEFNSQTIIKKYDGANSNGVSYLIKSSSDDFMNLITNDAYIVSVDTLSSSISAMLNKMLNIFKYLCFLCIFSSLLFNINMVFMDYIQNKKEETIIIALGLGKSFCKKYQLFKLILVVITSTIMSFGTYILILQITLKLFFNSSSYISLLYLLISLLISIVLAIITFNFPMRNLKKRVSYELLRE